MVFASILQVGNGQINSENSQIQTYFSLKSAAIWQVNSSITENPCIELFFESCDATPQPSVLQYGPVDPSTSSLSLTYYFVQISQPVQSIYFCSDSAGYIVDLHFYGTNGAQIEVKGINISSCDGPKSRQIVLTYQATFVGLNLVYESGSSFKIITAKSDVYQEVCSIGSFGINSRTPGFLLQYTVNQPRLEYDYTSSQDLDKVCYSVTPPQTWLFKETLYLYIYTTKDSDASINPYSITIAERQFIMGACQWVEQTITFDVVINPDCTVTIINERTIDEMSSTVNGSPVQKDVFFTDTVAQVYKIPTICGERIYSLAVTNTQTLSTTNNFLYVSESTTPEPKLNLFTQNPSDVGVYNVAMTVSLANYPLQSITKSFQVIIYNECGTTTIQSQHIKSVYFLKQNLNSLNMQIALKEYSHSAKIEQNTDCGEIKTSLVNSTSFMSLNNNIIELNFKGLKPGTYSASLLVELEGLPRKSLIEQFDITLASDELGCNPNIQHTYFLNENAYSFTINYQNFTYAGSFNLTPVFKPYTVDKSGKKIQEFVLPRFVNYKTNERLFIVESQDALDVGTYLIGLQVGYKEYPQHMVNCTDKLIVQQNATSQSNISTSLNQLEDQKIGCDPWSYKLPFENKSLKSFNIDLGTAQQVIEFDQIQMTLRKKSAYKLDEEMAYLLNITFIYQDELISQSFTAHYSCQSEVQSQVTINEFQTLQTINRKNKSLIKKAAPRPFIEFMKNIGIIRIGFTTEILIPTFDLYPEFLNDGRMRNCTYGNQCITQRLLALEANQTQQEQAIELVNKGIVKLKNFNYPLIDIQIIPSPYEDTRNLQFNWECQNFTSKYMDLKINFQKYKEISIQEERDVIKVFFFGNEYFRSSDNQTIAVKGLTLNITVPPQLDEATAKSLTSYGNSVSFIGKSAIVLMFIVSMISSGLLDQLFSIMNKLQIMVHLILIKVPIPTNASAFFNTLLSFVTFDLIPIKEKENQVLGFESIAFSDQFQELGYDSNYSIINMGTMFWVFILQCLVIAFILITGRIQNKTFKNFRIKLKNKIMWSGFIDFCNEGYLSLTISCLIELHSMKHDTKAETFSLSLAFIFLLISIGLPLFYLTVLQKNIKRINEENFIALYGDFCEKYTYKRLDRFVLLEPFISVTRRLVLALSCVYLFDYPYFNLFSMNLQMTFVVIYYGWVQPFGIFKDIFIEQISEVFIAMLVYQLFCFADLVTDADVRMKVGSWMISTISIALFIAFVYLLFISITSIVRLIKLKLKRKKNLIKMQIKIAKDKQAKEERQRVLAQYLEEQKNVVTPKEKSESEESWQIRQQQHGLPFTIDKILDRTDVAELEESATNIILDQPGLIEVKLRKTNKKTKFFNYKQEKKQQPLLQRSCSLTSEKHKVNAEQLQNQELKGCTIQTYLKNKILTQNHEQKDLALQNSSKNHQTQEKIVEQPKPLENKSVITQEHLRLQKNQTRAENKKIRVENCKLKASNEVQMNALLISKQDLDFIQGSLQRAAEPSRPKIFGEDRLYPKPILIESKERRKIQPS